MPEKISKVFRRFAAGNPEINLAEIESHGI